MNCIKCVDSFAKLDITKEAKKTKMSQELFKIAKTKNQDKCYLYKN